MCFSIKNLSDGEYYDTAFWIGLKVTDAAATSDSMCDSSVDPSGCHGIYEWLDGSAFEWGKAEFDDW